MRVATCKQMEEIDNATVNAIGVPGIVLMENAAIKVVSEIVKQLDKVEDSKILLFCGTGNNGGDGFAIARHLQCLGVRVFTVLVGDRTKVKGDALTNLDILEKMNIDLVYIGNDAEFRYVEGLINACDIVVDAIFGTGFRGIISDDLDKIICLINSLGKYIIAVDIPSGINGDTGEIYETCIKADKTVTFVMPKLGLLNYPACEYVGEMIVADISIPNKIIEDQNIKINSVEERYIKSILPVRQCNSNKGDYGKILIVAGSVGMTGAAVLAAMSALKTGSGLVTVGIPASINSIIQMKLTEAITIPLEDEGTGVLAYPSINKIIEKMDKVDVLVFGPGLSNCYSIRLIMEQIIKNSQIPVIIDADGINALAQNINILKQSKCPIILTPHPGEMSRLTGLSVDVIQANRVNIAQSLARDWNVTLVLKGAHTVIACADGTVYINLNGNPGMATAGMGDVLSGVIASLVGQGIGISQSTIAGVFIHGHTGDIVADRKGKYGLTAMDVVEALPEALKRLAPS